MRFLAHRGFWTHAGEKNAPVAFERAFAGGFGVETDIRDLDGTLVISHDVPRAGCQTLDDFLEIYGRHGRPGTLAINIKSDGLHGLLAKALAAHDCTDYFVFDMSVPDSLNYFKHGFSVFTRRSEYETASSLDAKAAGIWFDAFEQSFTPPQEVCEALRAGKQVALVSPELHGRDPMAAWTAWKDGLTHEPGAADRLMLCTDFPTRAKTFFTDLSDADR